MATQCFPVNLVLYLKGSHESFSLFRKDYPRDVVILHQVGRGPFSPSVSPFVMKMETYLRMAKIPYQVMNQLLVLFVLPS